MAFLRSIGRWTMVGLVINSIMGSGIFGLPSIVAGLVGRWSLIAYVAAAAITGIVTACFAEVASRFSEPGGGYLYTQVAFGPMVGVACGWLSWLTRSVSASAAVILLVAYAAGLWPEFSHPAMRIGLMSVVVVVLTCANLLGVRSGAGMSTTFAIAKLLPLLLLISIGLVFHPAHGHATTNAAASPGSWMDALLYLSFAFGGFDAAVMSLGELRDPRRDAPFGLFIGLGVVTAVYIGVQAVVLATIGTTASDRPLAAAADVLLGRGGAVLVSIGALLSIYGYLACQFVNVPRLMFAMGQRGDFPRSLAHTSDRYRTPDLAILAFGTAVLVMATLGSYKWAVLVGIATRILVYATVCLALIPLRRLRPISGYEVPWPRAFVAMATLFTAALVMRLDRWGSVLVASVIFSAVLFSIHRRRTIAAAARREAA